MENSSKLAQTYRVAYNKIWQLKNSIGSPGFLFFYMADSQLAQFLSEFVSERRLSLIEKVLTNRSRYVTILLEDIYQPQNASAVLRTCECMGVQDIHIIENNNTYKYNPGVAMGAGKWLQLHKYNTQKNNSLEAINFLKANNYRIVATVPGENIQTLNDFDVTKGKFAIVLGSELVGISDCIRENADEMLTIPMFGFTESFNISVSTAIILHQVFEKLRNSDVNWQLSDEERLSLKLEWIKSSIKKPELLVKKFYSLHPSNQL
jgi:tRNA (guanosine-2'-O-)-methyltransferase